MREQEQVADSLGHSPEGVNWSLKWGEDRGKMVGWARRVACVFCPPFLRCLVHGPCILPSFCSQYLRRGSWAFAFLYLVHHLPQLHMLCSYFQPLIVSLYFVAWRNFCPGTRTAIKGPRSQTPACLNEINEFIDWIYSCQLCIAASYCRHFRPRQ